MMTYKYSRMEHTLREVLGKSYRGEWWRALGMLILCLLLTVPSVMAQGNQDSNTVSGVVLDEQRVPLAGVTVSIANTVLSTSTDNDGRFSLNLPSQTENLELVLHFVGFKEHKQSFKPGDELTISLIEDNLALDEVVVIGFGTVKKRDLTGSVSSVRSEDIVRSPAHNAMESLQGQVPGLDIVRESGSATSGVDMRIRGNRSLSDAPGANSPLVIIDGMQGGNISDINPQDIETIDVLKDASSTAIYGSQGANGVIIVTTKRGKSGTPKINYNAYVGANGWAQYPDLLYGDAYLNLRREAARTSGQWNGPEDDQTLFTTGEWQAYNDQKWVNWKDEVFHTGVVQSHQLSVQGGNDKTTAFASGGYYRELGTFKNDHLDKYNLRLNIDQSIKEQIKVGLTSQITHFDGSERASNILNRAVQNVPLGTPYDSEGNVVLWPLGREGQVSPLADEASEHTAQYKSGNTHVIANGFLELKPIQGLSVRSNFGANLTFLSDKSFESPSSIRRAGEFTTSRASVDNTQQSFLNWDNIINYNLDLDAHSFNFTGLTSWTQSKMNYSIMAGEGQLIEEQLWHNLSANKKDSYTIHSDYVQSQSFSYALRMNYSYLGRYLFTLSNRWDGASRLSKGNKWAAFPSAAFAWRVSDEDWFDSQTVNDFKVRLSYGLTGNSGIREYGTQSVVTGHSNAAFQDQGYVYYTYNNMIGNENLGWEKSASWNLGVDLNLFAGRVNLVADLYNTKTTDILLPRTLPTSMGSGNNTPFQIYQNIGTTSNKGIEVVINTKNIDKTNFSWSSDITFGANKEKIVDLIDGTDIIGATTRETESLLIGRPLQSFYSFNRLGIWQQHEEDEAATYFKDKAKTQPFKPGDIKLADMNGDNVIDGEEDVTYLGSPVPKWVLGFNNSFNYKNFDLSVYTIVRWGQMMDYELTSIFNAQGKGNHPAHFDYWTPENPSNMFPRPSLTNFYNYLGYQSYNFVDGSYVKLKTITLGYKLPENIASKMKLNGLRVYASANNLFTWAKDPLVKNYDPERGGSATNPLLRQFVLGINLDI